VILFASCSNDIAQNSKISECGGFNKIDNFIKKAVCIDNSHQKIVKLNPEEDKCKDYLKWEYNESSKILSLTHLNSYLNCCGEHSIYVSEDGNDSYTIIEDDEPKGLFSDARCGCMCSFSFYTEIHNVKKESINISLKVDVEEEAEIKTLLNNSVIDLTQSESGKILIREFYSMGSCNE
jgi:hypothetical protein